VSPAELDGIVRSDMDSVTHNDLAHALGVDDLRYWGSTGTGGAAPCGMVGQAVGALLSGQAAAVLVFRSLNGRSGRRMGRPMLDRATTEPEVEVVGGDGTFDELFAPWGLVTPAQFYGLVARRHMIEFGTTAEQLGHVALACRDRARANPRAQMHDRALTMDDYLTSRNIAGPLRLFDCCLETDGACAVVVTKSERALGRNRPAALISGVAQGSGPEVQGGMLLPTLMRSSITRTPFRQIAHTLFARAGMGPADIDVAQLYDCFTISVLLELADLGFVDAGDSGPFAASGALDLGGALPINTGGGHLSEGYIHGMNHIVEGVRQLRGTSTSQVNGAETCLVTSGPPTASSALILRRAA
jgi:acetyl-CoA acetyltransferase